MRTKTNKFGVAKPEDRTYRGWLFGSKDEMAYAVQLDMMLAAGELAWWIRQVSIDLTDDDRVRMDFLVCDSYGHIYVAEVKGVETPKFRHTRKLWAKYAPFPMHIIKKGKTSEVLHGKEGDRTSSAGQ